MKGFGGKAAEVQTCRQTSRLAVVSSEVAPKENPVRE